MGIFNFFNLTENKDNEEDQAFLEEVRIATIKYFGSKTAKLNLKDKKGKSIDFIEAFPDGYRKCIEIKSPWDRRGIIFFVLDGLFANQMPPHMLAERLIEDRYPQKALEVLVNTGEPAENKQFYYVALSRVNAILGNYQLAIEYAKKAIENDDNFNKAKVALADAYHLAGKREEAHELYNQMLEKHLGEILKGSKNNLNIVELFGAEHERIRSPILAIEFIKENNLPEKAWKWAEDEFYFSPYFRCQHAYWLLENKKEMLQAFSKLLFLSKEMPWVKEAAINTLILAERIDPDGQKGIAKEDITKIKEIVVKNKWSSEGMYKLSI